MTAHPDPTPERPSPLLMLGGVLLIVLWLALALLWGTMLLMGGLMANDAGSLTSAQHLGLLASLLAGLLLSGVAGIPAGLALFRRSRRSRLLRLSAWLLLAGILLQVLPFFLFVQ